MFATTRQENALSRAGITSLCAGMALVLGILLIPSSAAHAREFSTGVAQGFPSTIPNQATVEAARIKSAGSKFALHVVPWHQVAPDELPATWSPADPAAPEYDWTVIDSRLVADRAAGLVPVLQIYGAPSLG